MLNIFYGILGSAIVAIIYGFFIANREDKIRNYLKNKRKGWSRRRYVSAFIGAVRGKAAATDTSVLGYLFLIAIFLLSEIYLFSASNIESKYSYYWEKVSETEEKIEKIENKTLSSAVTDTIYTIDDIKNDLKRIKEVLQKLEESNQFDIYRFRILGYGLLIGMYFGIIIWHPFIVMRRLFAHEIEHFTLRVQGLASKSELAELAIAESEVYNEDTLKSFVNIAKKIAQKNKIPELVYTFDLWNSDE